MNLNPKRISRYILQHVNYLYKTFLNETVHMSFCHLSKRIVTRKTLQGFSSLCQYYSTNILSPVHMTQNSVISLSFKVCFSLNFRAKCWCKKSYIKRLWLNSVLKELWRLWITSRRWGFAHTHTHTFQTLFRSLYLYLLWRFTISPFDTI